MNEANPTRSKRTVHHTERARRHSQAELRQLQYDKLTPAEKLERLNAQVGPNGAVKQRAKLAREIELVDGVKSSLNQRAGLDVDAAVARVKASGLKKSDVELRA